MASPTLSSVSRLWLRSRLSLPRILQMRGSRPLTQRVEELAAHFSAVPWRSPEAGDRVLFRSFLLEDTPLPASLLPALGDSLNRVPLERCCLFCHPRCANAVM